MNFCEQCGNKLKEGIKFCGKCGAPVPAEQTEDAQADVQDVSAPGACPQCGAPIEEGEMFCANCGAKIGDAPQYQSERVPAQPQAAFKVDFDFTFSNQTPAQYAKVVGYIEPCEDSYEFINNIYGGAIPKNYIPSCDEGFREAINKYAVSNLRIVLTDGKYHPVDSSSDSFRQAAILAFYEAYPKLKAYLGTL